MSTGYVVVEGPFHDKGVRVQGIYLSEYAALHVAHSLPKAYVHPISPCPLEEQRVIVVHKTHTALEGDPVVTAILAEADVDFEKLSSEVNAATHTWVGLRVH